MELSQLILQKVAFENLMLGIYGTWIMLLMLLSKHLLVDFFLQPPYMWKNKGKLFHPGGWLHAGLHGLATASLIYAIAPAGSAYVKQILLLAAVEIVAHFFIDYAKVNVCARFGWKPHTSPYYWHMLGLDQFFHQLCYLVITVLWLTTA